MNDKKSLMSLYGRDLKAEENGVWVELSLGGIEMKIRSMGSTTHENVRSEVLRPYMNRLQKLSATKKAELLAKVVAYGLIIDWKNVYDDDGNEIKFSPETAYELLKQPELVDFVAEIMTEASDVEKFKQNNSEVAAKN